MPILDHFGILAPFYDTLIRVREPELLIELADLPTDRPLLDAGGGTGRVSQTIRHLAPLVVVADLSTNMLREAAKKRGLETVGSHTERLPFPDGYFGRIIMVDALHHVCDQADTAFELWRVLHPGGRLVVIEPDIGNFSVKLVALAEKLALMRSHFLSPEQIGSLFPYPDGRVEIVRESFNGYVVVHKDAKAERVVPHSGLRTTKPSGC